MKMLGRRRGDAPGMSDTERDDDSMRDLVARFAGGDESALGQIIEKESMHLRRRLEKKTPPHLLQRVGVSDLLQETAVELMKVREGFENRGPVAFRRLLELVADRVLMNTIEREEAKKRTPRREAAPRPTGSGILDPLRQLAAGGQSPSATASQREVLEVVNRCFSRLGPEDREVLHLIEERQLDYGEVSEKLGISYEATRKRYRRALERLRELTRAEGLDDF